MNAWSWDSWRQAPAAVAGALRRRSQLLLLLLALGLGGLGAIGARGYVAEQLARERARLNPAQPMVAIVVAKRELARGETIDPAKLAVRDIPRTYLAPGTVLPERIDEFIGARLNAPLQPGEPLLQAALEGADVGTFAAKVPAGVRAFTVVVDEVNSLSGMLQPGDRIDLLLSARLPGTPTTPSPPELTRTFLQDIKVLATGRQVRPGGDDKAGRSYGAITVEVTPDQAARLVVAQRNGKLSAVLRNPRDRDPAHVSAIDVYQVLGLPSPGASGARATGPVRVTELIVGGQGVLRSRPSDAPGIAPAMALAAPYPVAAPQPAIAPVTSGAAIAPGTSPGEPSSGLWPMPSASASVGR